ncbi:glutaminyl-tRNA synthetase [Prevotella sp. tc2-28]|jgi:glutaminyl-tRNA synthetase|uniref:glutamine--tRNA ligase/YqeY domain fusion protein n=1 Tax=Prevotella sp. tc2-28 TaxID=1761888 RepID=UPI0008990271|nr:glutamine--tRNA ligase/YqeY domain fusion protein [Prevotella sp. tc2-28]SEA91384.1 glutaminyl-tRNA synthetase [Prevotella sp. tc2-28]
METNNITAGEEKKSLSFVEQFVKEDLEAGKNGGRIQTRFPPEPNGYIHIGHAKAICMDFGVAEKFGGICNLRFDDTNPTKENTEYVENIMNDIKWLGFHWENVYYASDYFEKLWDFAIWLINKGMAYVDEQTSEQIAEQKGTPTQPGKPSPFRDRPIEENLRLFQHMNTAEAVEGSMVLRAKLDMANPNMHFRDPIIYRIIQIPHHRTGTKWHCYPMYDFAHGQSDFFEGVTHSICTLEFVPHRPLYDKFVDFLLEKEGKQDYRPRQIEFNRLNLTYTVMSKRKLKALVDEQLVNGWDDPRMPTVCGMRRRGYSAQSIRNFIDSIGYTKFDALNDYALLEASVRDDLNKKACRVSAVLDPVKLVITNYPEGKTEEMQAVNNPENEADGTHTITFSRELWIERDDFMEVAEKKFMRLAPGKEVRLKNAYIIKCDETHPCDKDAAGNVTTIYATYDPETRSGQPGADRKIKGKTLHWLNCQDAIPAEVRLYDRLFKVENPGADERDFRELLNPESLTVLNNCYVEKYLKEKKAGDFLQFQRIGYFTPDLDSTPEHLVFNKTVGLKDSWAKTNK